MSASSGSSNGDGRAGYRWTSLVAAAAALALGTIAAVMLIVGHHPWDGRVVADVEGSHGLHRGDILAVIPAVVSIALACWCALQGRPDRR